MMREKFAKVQSLWGCKFIVHNSQIQMKYSLIANSEPNHLASASETRIKRSTSDYRSAALLEVEGSTLRLTSLQGAASKTTNINAGQVDWKQAVWSWEGEDEWVLVLQRPFRIVLALKKYSRAVELQLEQSVELEQLACTIVYPDLLIYGHAPTTFENRLVAINLATLQLRDLAPPKGYSPGARTGYWAHFSEGRLYVSGGLDKQGKPQEELLWTFNLENGYWFALEMPMGGNRLPLSGKQIEFESGKVFLIGSDSLWMIELYQSRATLLSDWQKQLDPTLLSQITGLFIQQEWIYLHSDVAILQPRLRINKTKL